MVLTIVLLPLLSSFLAGAFGKYFGPKVAGILTVIGVSSTFLLSFGSTYTLLLGGNVVVLQLCPWIISGSFNLYWSFLFDSLTLLMLNVVTFISLLVHLYSLEYMSHDPHLPRFMSYLSLFTFFMIILVTGDNLVQLFVGWEGVGLCSYLLINFWFTRIQANKAAIKAMIMNRIGDVALALGIFACYISFHAIDFATIFSCIPLFSNAEIELFGITWKTLDIIGILLFIGAMGKSAQLGLHTWLPDAMEGPTPVSALIHAATMVTAGVFLIARCSPLYEFAPEARFWVCCLGAATAFFAATVGLLQNDLKRVIAYSTCSQLGYMVFVCGVSQYNFSVFHLSNHAFFKALLFLSAGAVIHAMADEQDMRRMGGLRRLLPMSYAMFVLGSIALMGIPFLSGFFSKDAILEAAFSSYDFSGHLAYWLGSFAAFLTAFYSVRLLYLVFLAEPSGFRPSYVGAHDAPLIMAIPLMALTVPSLLIGFLTKDMIIGLGTNFWGNAIFIHPFHQLSVDAEFIPFFYKNLPLLLSLLGSGLSFFIYCYGLEILTVLGLSKTNQTIYNFFNRKWFFDRIYSSLFGAGLMAVSYNVTYKLIDKGLIEITGPKASIQISKVTGQVMNSSNSGLVYFYMLMVFLCLGGILVIFVNFPNIWNWFFLKLIVLLAINFSLKKTI